MKVAQLWADPRLVYAVAGAAVATLLFTIWLFRRRGRGGRQAGLICLLLSVGLHVALILLVPLLPSLRGGSSTTDSETDEDGGIDGVSFSTFDPDMLAADAAGDAHSPIAPLPVANLESLLGQPPTPEPESREQDVAPEPARLATSGLSPSSLSESTPVETSEVMASIDSMLDELLSEAAAAGQGTPSEVAEETPMDAPTSSSDRIAHVSDEDPSSPASTSTAPRAMVPGDLASDYAKRLGKAKFEALERTGGDENTEAAVEAALKFLAEAQRSDGAWDPRASGAGIERSPLGMTRGGAGSRAETALTGLALLSLIGAGQTHQRGQYSDNAYRGLVYLIQNQKPDGSLAGAASVYESTYCHGMAALAMCETAAITRDPSAIACASRTIGFTRAMQHPTTGGWRYTAGDPGDLSQLGWQAMVLDAGYRAGVPVDPRSVEGVERFLRSVRAGSQGGLASYRAGEQPSRTMTAEALATRLLIGQNVPAAEIAEAERYLLQQLPGVGQDNYYYWYYATLALHQLQDEAWQQWNVALKNRLLATQRADGSWPSDTVWGGYGGTVYTTAMATLCLEVYYRHAIRSDSNRIANQTPVNPTR